jgi:hypothetical protein
MGNEIVTVFLYSDNEDTAKSFDMTEETYDELMGFYKVANSQKEFLEKVYEMVKTNQIKEF